jgi:hypothetical protein
MESDKANWGNLTGIAADCTNRATPLRIGRQAQFAHLLTDARRQASFGVQPHVKLFR